jgi:branched-chain amino acid transport system permease protein
MSKKKLVKFVSYGTLIIILFLIPLVITGPYQLHIFIMAGIAVILTSSLRLIFNSGQLSLGQGGMMTIGAYTSALLVMKMGWSTWVALGAATATGALMALLVGYPFVRLKGIYFSLVTVFLAEVIRLIAEQWRSVTGGSLGISNIPLPDPIKISGLLEISFTSKVDFYYLILVFTLISLFILYTLEQSRVGITWFSIRESDSLAESIGVDTTKFKVLAFCIGSLFAGLAGGLYSQYNSVITPSTFGFFYAVYVLIYMIVGGAKKFSGPIVGAVILTFVPELARILKGYQPYIFAVVVILIIVFMPEGLVSISDRFIKLLRERQGRA